jgi:thioredoxin reductase (NADPH)
VVGGGDSAVEEAGFLAKFARRVTIVHRRDKLRASKIMQYRIVNSPKIEVLWNATVVEFLGNGVLTGVKIKNEITGSLSDLEVHGAFEAIGQTPNTAFLSKQLGLDDPGHIRTEPGTTATSVEGVFAAGDIVDKRYRQAITASGSGCMAAMDAERWLMEKNLLG